MTTNKTAQSCGLPERKRDPKHKLPGTAPRWGPGFRAYGSKDKGGNGVSLSSTAPLLCPISLGVSPDGWRPDWSSLEAGGWELTAGVCLARGRGRQDGAAGRAPLGRAPLSGSRRRPRRPLLPARCLSPAPEAAGRGTDRDQGWKPLFAAVFSRRGVAQEESPGAVSGAAAVPLTAGAQPEAARADCTDPAPRKTPSPHTADTRLRPGTWQIQERLLGTDDYGVHYHYEWHQDGIAKT